MVLILLLALLDVGCEAARAIWAVNAGGGAHRGVDGVVYGADPSNMPGVTSDHGIHHLPLLARVHPQVTMGKGEGDRGSVNYTLYLDGRPSNYTL